MKSSVAKRTGQWTAVAALATLLTDYINDWANNVDKPWEHVVGVIAVAVIGAVVSLAEGKGSAAAADDAADDPDVPDGDGG